MLDPRMNYVVAAAKAGSFTAAAEIVGVTQSAVTRSIADLEEEVGYAIFHRTSRGAMLTEEGRDFAERATRLLEDARELLRGRAGERDPYDDIVRIGVCPASLEWRLSEPVAALLRHRPQVKVDISGASFERMIQQLRGGGVDIAIGFEAAFSDWPDLRREPLSSYEGQLFVRRGHPLTQGCYELADLAKFDFVSPSDSRPYGSTIKEMYETQGVDWRRRIHVVDHFPIARQIVANSDAIGVVAVQYAASAPWFSEKFEILHDAKLFSSASQLCFATRARWKPPPVVRALISALRETLPAS